MKNRCEVKEDYKENDSHDFCLEILLNQNFDLFFEKYPNKDVETKAIKSK